MQSILDYTRSPDTTSSAAIDPVFGVTSITNEEGQADYPYCWAGTTHVRYPDYGDAGAYLAFGRGLGYMDSEWRDVHGAGCQRSDPKTGDPDDYPFGHGPQGDAIRIYNYVRCVRGPFCPQDLDQDGDIDAADFALFADCMAGPEVVVSGACDAADLSSDGDIDLEDFANFQARFTGDGSAAYPACLD